MGVGRIFGRIIRRHQFPYVLQISTFCLEKLTIFHSTVRLLAGNAGGALRPVHPGAYSGGEWAGWCQEGGARHSHGLTWFLLLVKLPFLFSENMYPVLPSDHSFLPFPVLPELAMVLVLSRRWAVVIAGNTCHMPGAILPQHRSSEQRCPAVPRPHVKHRGCN